MTPFAHYSTVFHFSPFYRRALPQLTRFRLPCARRRVLHNDSVNVLHFGHRCSSSTLLCGSVDGKCLIRYPSNLEDTRLFSLLCSVVIHLCFAARTFLFPRHLLVFAESCSDLASSQAYRQRTRKSRRVSSPPRRSHLSSPSRPLGSSGPWPQTSFFPSFLFLRNVDQPSTLQ